jgi:hypothetical protein
MDYDLVIQSRPKLVNQETDSKQNEGNSINYTILLNHNFNSFLGFNCLEIEKTSNCEETLKRPIEAEESETPDNKQLKLDN